MEYRVGGQSAGKGKVYGELREPRVAALGREVARSGRMRFL